MRFLPLALCTITVVYWAKAVVSSPVHQSESENVPIAILHQDSAVNPDGSHYNVWESENGIKVQKEGRVKFNDHDGNIVRSLNGKFPYYDENGNLISLTYVADENGYQPQGEHLPQSPPVHTVIARGVESLWDYFNAKKEQSKPTPGVERS